MLFSFFTTITFFLGILCLDARREEARRVWILCLPKKTPLELKEEKRKQDMLALEMEQGTAKGMEGEGDEGGMKHSKEHASSGHAGGAAEISNFSIMAFKARVVAYQCAQMQKR